MHGFFNFQLETCGSRVEDYKTIFLTKGATFFRTSQVLKDVGMFFGGEMLDLRGLDPGKSDVRSSLA